MENNAIIEDMFAKAKRANQSQRSTSMFPENIMDDWGRFQKAIQTCLDAGMSKEEVKGLLVGQGFRLDYPMCANILRTPEEDEARKARDLDLLYGRTSRA